MSHLKPINTVTRHTRLAREKKEALILYLGGKCEKEGITPCEGELQFDHIHGRDYNPNKLSYGSRMNRYVKEAQAGLLRLLCEKHNLEFRVKNDNGKLMRTEHKDEVVLTSHMDFATGNPF